MAQTPSGTISFSDINTALGRSSTAAISMNDSNVRFLANQDTGSVNMNAMRNKYYFSGTVTVALYSDKGTDYYGYDSQIPYGSGTGTLFSSRTLVQLNSRAGPINVITSNSGGTPAFPNVSMRLQVGSNSAVPMAWYDNDSYVGSTVGLAIGSANVGSTLNWQFAQT